MPSGRKLGVFVGSTKKDLAERRDAVIGAILNAGHVPSGMELWAAGHIPTQDAIKEHLSLCDVHLIILGARYGARIRPKGKSFTEWEYDISRKARRPVIAFLLDPDAFDNAVGSLSREEKKTLRKFREELESRALCRYFPEKGLGAIATDCVNSIAEAINSGKLKEHAGWIRASSEDAKTLRQIERNPFLNNILERIRGFSTLTGRFETESEAKGALSRCFWDLMFGRIRRSGYRALFFESGSTLTYVSEGFRQKVDEAGGGSEKEWEITTNNAMALLQLLLHTNIDANPLPSGRPENYYGAMFGSALLEYPETHPMKPRALYPTEQKAVGQLARLLRQGSSKRLFLATASGLDLDHQQKQFRGPHIGSHPNMLFKRAIFQTRQPVILFLTERKVGAKFNDGRCYPVFGPDHPWEHVLREYPLALCIGYHSQSPGKLRQMIEDKLNLRPRDWNYAQKRFVSRASANSDGIPGPADSRELRGGVVIIANEQFTRKIPKE